MLRTYTICPLSLIFSVDDDSRLTKLKKDIYDRPGLHRFKYDYAKELGDAVLKEYTRLID